MREILHFYQTPLFSIHGTLLLHPYYQYLIFPLSPHHPIHRAPILREHQVQEHRNNSRNYKWRLHNQIQTLLKALEVDITSGIVEDLVEPAWLHDVDESDSQGRSEDEAVATREGDQAEDTDTSDSNGRIEKNLHTT